MNDKILPLSMGSVDWPGSLSPIELLFYVSRQLQPNTFREESRCQWTEMNERALAVAGDESDPAIRWQHLWHLFYRDYGFSAAWQDYFSVQSSMADSILQRRTGNAASLAILLQSLCEQLGLHCYLIDFPGQLMLSIPSAGIDCLDPLSGTSLNRHELELRVRGQLGNLTRLTPEHLAAASPLVAKQRFLDSLKQACLLKEAFSEGLICSELLLQLVPDDPVQVLERGYILQHLNHYQGAAADFSFFVQQCPDHPNAELLKLQIATLEEQQVVFH